MAHDALGGSFGVSIEGEQVPRPLPRRRSKVNATLPCLIFDDEGAVLSAGRYPGSSAPAAGALLKVGLDDPQPLIEHRVAAPERPLLVLLGEGLLVAGHVQRISFNPNDGGSCLLRVTECRHAPRLPPLVGARGAGADDERGLG